MTLASTERREAGRVVDQHGRPVYRVVNQGDPPLTGEREEAGRAVDPDGRQVIILNGTSGGSGGVGSSVVATGTNDSAAITAAFEALRGVDGKIDGTLRVGGPAAALNTPLVFDLGYPDVASADWSVSTPRRFTLELDAVPAAGLGAAITIRGGYHANIRIRLLGGGGSTQVTDAHTTAGSTTVSSPNAVAAGLKAGAVIMVTGAGPAPEGIPQPLMASVRSVNAGAGTFVVSEAAEITVTGGALTWMDAGVRVENLAGSRLDIAGKSFAGALLVADATDDVTKQLVSANGGSLYGNNCGQTLFWKSINAYGNLGNIWSNCVYGDYMGQLADTKWDHYEGGVGSIPHRAVTYLWLDRCNELNAPTVSVGDRATEALMKITGATDGGSSNLGRFAQIRCTAYMARASAQITNGSATMTSVRRCNGAGGNDVDGLTIRVGQTITAPGIPEGAKVLTVTGDLNVGATVTLSATATGNLSPTYPEPSVFGHTTTGLKLIGVQSVEIDTLETARCVIGLDIVGGGDNGIRIKRHVSFTSDNIPTTIRPGAVGTTPRVNIVPAYRYHYRYSLDIKAGLGAGTDIKFHSGHLETMHILNGAFSLYAIRSASTAVILDTPLLDQTARSGMLGLVDPATVVWRGQHMARLGNDVPATGKVWVTDGSGGYTLQTN